SRSEPEVQLPVERKQFVVHGGTPRLWFVNTMRRAKLFLRFCDGGEGPRSKKRENDRAQAGHIALRHQNELVQYVRVNLVQGFVALRYAAAVNNSIHTRAIFTHPRQNNARMKSCAFNRRKQFVFGGMRQIPAE